MQLFYLKQIFYSFIFKIFERRQEDQKQLIKLMSIGQQCCWCSYRNLMVIGNSANLPNVIIDKNYLLFIFVMRLGGTDCS